MVTVVPAVTGALVFHVLASMVKPNCPKLTDALPVILKLEASAKLVMTQADGRLKGAA